MPLALVTANRSLVDYEGLVPDAFANNLRIFIAETLTCEDEGGDLSAADIEVRLEYRKPGTHFGGEQYDIQVVVFANDFPFRGGNLDERTTKLKMLVQTALPPSTRGSVWVLLAPAAFVEF